MSKPINQSLKVSSILATSDMDLNEWHWSYFRGSNILLHTLLYRKYSITEKLVNLVTDTVDLTVDTMLKNEGLDKPFYALDYVHNLFNNILAASAFGKRY